MKHILLICVTYRSYGQLSDFLSSVESAAALCPDVHVDVAIADNTPKEESVSVCDDYNHISIKQYHFYDNLGYLGAAQQIYNHNAAQYDFCAITNVDLTLAPDFFSLLLTIDTNTIGWIAPDIYTISDHRHENPYMLSRPSKFNFFIWNIIYSSQFINKIYNILHKLKRENHPTPSHQDIYAAHGSFMLFTGNFISMQPILSFPTFLYGEEIYIAELTRLSALKVVYIPQLKIYNSGHVNMSAIPQTQRSKWSKQSLIAIRNAYFK
ncbi:MAG: hypothetical protein IJ776_10460 [Paludibacteraceae bacterium]|nr:hypothetical protein [Paludibacteraceae bacterium]